MVFSGVLERNRHICVMCCVPISGYLFARVEDRSYGCLTGFLSHFQPFCAMQEGGWLATSQQGGRGVKSCVAYFPLPFLGEKS